MKGNFSSFNYDTSPPSTPSRIQAPSTSQGKKRAPDSGNEDSESPQSSVKRRRFNKGKERAVDDDDETPDEAPDEAHTPPSSTPRLRLITSKERADNEDGAYDDDESSRSSAKRPREST
jgi:hypothetical protein